MNEQQWGNLDAPPGFGDSFADRVVVRQHVGEALETADAEIYSLYLLREAQGRGIGRALLRVVAAVLQQRGFKSVGLWVLERNRSRGFYESCGGRLAQSSSMLRSTWTHRPDAACKPALPS